MTVSFERTQPADYLIRLAASDLGRAYKGLVVQEMAIEPGHLVLDLGCGPGADLRAYAESTGPAGTVVGVDHDASAVEQARALVSDLPNVQVLLADVHDLDLADNYVERAHTDRVLQHVADAARVLTEVHGC